MIFQFIRAPIWADLQTVAMKVDTIFTQVLSILSHKIKIKPVGLACLHYRIILQGWIALSSHPSQMGIKHMPDIGSKPALSSQANVDSKMIMEINELKLPGKTVANHISECSLQRHVQHKSASRS